VNGCTLFHKGNNPKSRNIDGSKPTISAYQQNADAPAILGQVEAEGRKERVGMDWFICFWVSSDFGEPKIISSSRKKSTWSDESCWVSSCQF